MLLSGSKTHEIVHAPCLDLLSWDVTITVRTLRSQFIFLCVLPMIHSILRSHNNSVSEAALWISCSRSGSSYSAGPRVGCASFSHVVEVDVHTAMTMINR
jgi:hypothetical protein